MTIREQVKRFWQIFMGEQDNLEHALSHDHRDEISEIVKILSTYFEELCNCNLEVSIDDAFYEITFNSDGDKNAQYVCALMKKMAPESVRAKWIINAFIPPLSQKALNTILKVKDQEYTCDDFTIFYEVDKINRLINADVYCDAFTQLEPNKALEISMYLIKMFIGETEFEARMNTINAVDTLSDFEDQCPLTKFYEAIETIVETNKWVQYQDPTQIYMVYQLSESEPSQEVRKDMHMVMCGNPHMIAETLNDEYYIAESFYDWGGEFGYLYYEHEKTPAASINRQKLEKALNEILYDHSNIARSIGGAIGSKYAYIDLAIFDKPLFNKALEKIIAKTGIAFKYVTFE